jgi:glutathione synthase/RimK-type ligase-like ATP-grasp enzyme
MSDWVIIVDRLDDFPQQQTEHAVATSAEYLARPQLFARNRPKVINLARSYTYASRGYYCSLLAEARGQRVMPSVESMMEISSRSLYAAAVPELEDSLNRCAEGKVIEEEAFDLLICFGVPDNPVFERFARLLFDWFRCPILEVTVAAKGTLSIRRIRTKPVNRLDPNAYAFFRDCLERHTRRAWRSPKPKVPAQYSLAVLYDPDEALPPSSVASLKRLARVAERMGVEAEPITRRDLHRLAEFDALFIRETTYIDNHTYRFARRAVQEGMPVIDDPVSMLRCTNKVYLNELLTAHKLPVPRTRMVSNQREARLAAEELGLPMVLKIPDGSFSRGVLKVETMDDLTPTVTDLLKQSDLLLAQAYMPTDFDWRVGVLGGEPLFVCQYLMAKKHWQIVRHGPGGRAVEGGSRTFLVEDAPTDVVNVAVRAARLIGDGLYGVDLKQNDQGVFIIEINDNPNLDYGVEDAALKDVLWERVVQWFLNRLDRNGTVLAPDAVATTSGR